jgi:integrase
MDDEMAQYPGLVQRDGVWLVRKRIPVDLQHIDARGSIRISLGTRDKREAIRLYPLKLAEIQAGFDQLRVELREKPFVKTALMTGRIEGLGRAALEDIVRGWWEGRAPFRQPNPDDPEDVREALSDIERDLATLDAHDGEGGDDAARVADRLLVDAGVPSRSLRVGAIKTQVKHPVVDSGSMGYATLRSLVAEALRYEAMLARDHLVGKQTTPPHPIFNPDGSSAMAEGTFRVGDLVGAFRAEREKLHGTESTARKYGLLFRVIEECWGSQLPIRDVSRQRCVDLVAFLESLPSNGTKRFPELSLAQLIEANAEKNHKRLAPNTVASYVQNLSALLRWGKLHGYGVTVNTEGLKPKGGAEVERRGMTAAELDLIFKALSAHRHETPHKFWVPALAVYTGARAEELCQLRTEDVVEIDGVKCLNLTRFDARGRAVKEKRFKNRNSERIVPIHDELLASGFMEFVESAAHDQRLFPALMPSSKGNYSHNLSKWFGRFMDSVGLSDPALVFHSFRHGFRDACRMADLAEETAHALGGWATVNQGQRYGNRGAVPLLYRALKRVTYAPFSLRSATETPAQRRQDVI